MVSPYEKDDFANINYLYDFYSKDSKVGKEFFDYVHIFQECMEDFNVFTSDTSENLSGLYWQLAIFRNDKKKQLDSTADKIIRKFMDQVETCLEKLTPTSSPELKKTPSKSSLNETTSLESSSMKSSRGSLSSPASSSIKSDHGDLPIENEIDDDEIDTYKCHFHDCEAKYEKYLELLEKKPSATEKELEESISDLEESFVNMEAILESLNEHDRKKIQFKDRFEQLLSEVKTLKLNYEQYNQTRKLNDITKDFDICLKNYNKYVKELDEDPDVEVVVYTSRFQKLKFKIEEILGEINKLSAEFKRKIYFTNKLKFMKQQSEKYINALKPVKPSIEKSQILPFSIPKTELVFYKLEQDPEIFQKNMVEIDELFERFDELKDLEIVDDMLDVLNEMEARVAELEEFFNEYDATTELAKEKKFDEYQKDAKELIPEFHTQLKAHIAHIKPSENAKDQLP